MRTVRGAQRVPVPSRAAAGPTGPSPRPTALRIAKECYTDTRQSKLVADRRIRHADARFHRTSLTSAPRRNRQIAASLASANQNNS